MNGPFILGALIGTGVSLTIGVMTLERRLKAAGDDYKKSLGEYGKAYAEQAGEEQSQQTLAAYGLSKAQVESYKRTLRALGIRT